MQIDKDHVSLLATLAGIGGAVGISQLLLSDEKITLRRSIGKAVASAGLAVAAGSVLAFIPGLDSLALIGMSAAFSTMGTEGLFKLANRVIDKKVP